MAQRAGAGADWRVRVRPGGGERRGLPSLYFYCLLAGVRMTMLEVVVHAVKSKAVAAVALVGILPIYVAVAMGVVIFDAGEFWLQATMFLGLAIAVHRRHLGHGLAVPRILAAVRHDAGRPGGKPRVLPAAVGAVVVGMLLGGDAGDDLLAVGSVVANVAERHSTCRPHATSSTCTA